jgi:hypothetical protein
MTGIISIFILGYANISYYYFSTSVLPYTSVGLAKKKIIYNMYKIIYLFIKNEH